MMQGILASGMLSLALFFIGTVSVGSIYTIAFQALSDALLFLSTNLTLPSRRISVDVQAM